MTTISSPVTSFRVAVRTDSGEIGVLNCTDKVDEARAQVAQTRLAFPKSTLQAYVEGADFGEWRDFTEDDLDELADVNAALALAHLLDAGLPRIDWSLSKFERGKISGHTRNRDIFAQYAVQLKAGPTETEKGTSHTRLEAEGSFQGVPVSISCHVRNEQPAEVSA